MKILKIISISLVLSFVFNSCSKTKLVGKYDGLAGTWKWFAGWSDNGNPNFKLDLKEKGKYKLYNGSKKIDYGNMLEKNGKLAFMSEVLLKGGYFAGGNHQIIFHSPDTIGIGSDHISDFPSSWYVKE